VTARPERSSRPAERGAVALAGAVGVVVFLLSWALLHVGFYERDQIVDTPVYQRYGDAMENGDVPYRDFDLEYPPAALPVFVAPSFFTAEGDRAGYDRAFDRLMAVCGAAAVALMAVALAALGTSFGASVGAAVFAGLAPLALGSVLLTRFDLWPAALAVGALAAFLSGRVRLGSGVLGVAVAAKLYPAVLVPLAALWVWRRQGRRDALVCAGVFAGALAAAFVPFLVLAPEGVAGSIERQLSRPLQIESLGAALVVAAHHLFGLDVAIATTHGSQNVGGNLGVGVGIVASGLQAAALVAVWLAFAAGPMSRVRLVQHAAAAVAAFVALGKVLSPQFLIWLIPLVPLVRGRRGLVASALLALALVATQLWFPFRYWEYASGLDGPLTALVLVRDLLLVALLGALVWPQRES
jgi:hypothetical protein